MSAGTYLGQMVGRRFGSYLGQQLALGACREDRDDDFERRGFTPRLPSNAIPPAVDLRRWMTPVEDQGRLGSCAANALVGGLEYLVRRESGRPEDFSRLFVYFAQRLWDDSVREDLGASLVDGVRAMSRLGVPTERSWPYHPDLFGVQPPRLVLREAGRTKVTDWWSVPVDPDAFRGCLAAGFPIAFGTKVTESFVRTPKSGLTGMPRGADDRRHGRHALLAVGYDDRARRFVVRNSWGQDWGDGGYVYMPYDYVLNRRWTRNCWALRVSERQAFDPGEHGGVDLRSLPKAPPRSKGGGAVGAAGTVGAVGAQMAVSMFTGSGLLAGLAGGLVSGIVPGVSRALSGRDQGAHVGEDLGERILQVMKADAAAPAAHLPWDDGLDEEAIGAPTRSRGRKPAVRKASPRKASPRKAREPAVRKASRRTHEPTPRGAASPAVPVVAGAAVLAGAARRTLPAPASASGTPHETRPSNVESAEPSWVETLPPRMAAFWRRDGGRMGPLGAPVEAPRPVTEGAFSGTAVRFSDGTMLLWEPPSGAPPPDPIVLLHADLLVADWTGRGGGRSALGWPVRPPEEEAGARVLRCLRGTLVGHPDRAPTEVHGALFFYWRQHGEMTGTLGFPLADAAPSDSGAIVQAFERGRLMWSPATGVQPA
ncbi:MAG: C1 family peptidase [Sandaracinaceae bacterium]